MTTSQSRAEHAAGRLPAGRKAGALPWQLLHLPPNWPPQPYARGLPVASALEPTNEAYAIAKMRAS